MKATLLLIAVAVTALLEACNGSNEDDACTTQPLGTSDTSLVTATQDSVRIITTRAESTSTSAKGDSLRMIPASVVAATSTRDTVQKPGRLCYVFTTSDTVQRPPR